MLWITIRVYVYRGMVYTSFSGQALSKNVSNTITTLGNYGAGRQCSNCSLYLHGRVMCYMNVLQVLHYHAHCVLHAGLARRART